MEISIDKYGLQGTPTSAILSHNGESLEWNICIIDKMSGMDGYDIFEHINAFWGRMHVSTQNKIFQIYKNIRAIFDTTWELEELIISLRVVVKELYELHNIAEVRHWVDFHSNIIIPDSLMDVFEESYTTPGTRERTYLKEDYRWLVALSIAIRPMIPIWGEFIHRTRKETGTHYKEYHALRILNTSSIYHSEPMERLFIYITQSIPANTEKTTQAHILYGLSSEEYPTWLISLIVIRRLSTGDVRGLDPNTSLVSFIYKYIGQRILGHGNNTLGTVSEKNIEGQGQDGENNLSMLEGYKVKQDIAAGDVAIINYYLSYPENYVTQICPDFDMRLLDECLITTRELESNHIWKQQTILTQWVLKPVVSPKGLLRIEKVVSLKAMAAAASLLIHRGHYELAGLLTAVNVVYSDELMINGPDSRARITKDQVEQLDKLYPYPRKPTGKQKVLKLVNPATESIDLVASAFSQHNWRLTLPDWVVEKITGNPNVRNYATPYNIKVLLAKLAIDLASRKF